MSDLPSNFPLPSVPLSQPNKEEGPSSPLSLQSSAIIISQLQEQIQQLHRVIALKDHTLEEIRLLVDRTFGSREGIHSLQIIQKGLESASRKYSEGVRRSLSYEISAEIDEDLGDQLAVVREEFQRIMQHHKDQLETLESEHIHQQLSINIAQYQPKLVEIPVEVYLEKDVESQGMQVDLFQSVKNSESQGIRLENIMLRTGFTPVIREIPVEIDTYDIPVEIYVEKDQKSAIILKGGMEETTPFQQLNHQNQQLKEQIALQTFTFKESHLFQQAELETLRKQIQDLEAQNSQLKGEVSRIRQESFSFEIQITAPFYNIQVNDREFIEVPMEFNLDNQAGSQFNVEIFSDQVPAAYNAGNNEETRPNIASEVSIPKHRPQIQTRSEISQENPSPLNKQGSIILSQQSQPQLKASPAQHSPIQIIEVPVELMTQSSQIRCIQVPVEVIQYVEVPLQVIRHVEVAVKVIEYVEVPVEVIKYIEVPIVRYIQVPIATVEEVEVYSIMPVEVEVEVERIVERIVEVQVIHEIPVELIIIEERPQEVEEYNVGKLHASIPLDQTDLPMELEIDLQIEGFNLQVQERVVEVEKIVQKIVQKRVEVEKIVEKIIYVDRPIQIVKTVFVEKIVEVPVEVFVERRVEYEIVIERTNETVIEKTKETIIDHNVIYQIPVELQIHPQNNQQNNHQTQETKPITLHASQQHEQAYDQQDQIQITYIQFVFEEQPINSAKEQQVIQKIVEVPVQVYIDRIVEVEVIKIVEVEVIKIVEVPVIQIVQVPVQLQQEVKIIERYLPYLVEVPVQLKTSDLFEVPIEMEMETLVYEVPIDVVNAMEVVEIPLEMQEPPIIIEVPVQMNILEEESIESPKNQRKTSNEAPNQEIDSPTVRFSLKEHHQTDQRICEQVFMIPLNQVHNQIEIQTYPYMLNTEIIVEIPYEVYQDRPNQEINTVSKDDQQVFGALALLEGEAKPSEDKSTPQIRIVEVPVQIELDNSEQIRKTLEYKYRDRISDLHGQYSAEIASLHEMLQSLQRVIIEGQQELEHLKDELEGKALHEESFHCSISKLQEELNNKNGIIAVKEQENAALLASSEELRLKYADISSKLHELQSEPPVLYETTVEMVIKVDKQQIGLQTDDLPLPADISVIQIPIQLEIVEKITESSLKRSEDEQVRSSSTNNKYFKGFTEEQLQQKLKAMTVKAELMDTYTQTEKRDTIDDLMYDMRTDPQLNITDMLMLDNTQFNKEDKIDPVEISRNYRFYADVDQSIGEQHLISGIESIADYENVIDLKIYEYAVEVFPEPVIYEVPVDLRVFKELSVSEVQTEDVYSQIIVQKKILEIPVQVNVKKQTSQISIQTEAQTFIEHSAEVYRNNEMVGSVPQGELVRDLLYASNNVDSKFIEIPIELNIQVDKETISVDIQTKETWNAAKEDLQPMPQSSKLRITPAFQQHHIAFIPQIAKGNPYETQNMIRLQSDCFSIPEHRIFNLASHNQSITYQQCYGDNLLDTQKLLQSQSNKKALMESADIRDLVNSNDVIVEEHEVYHSRVVVHIEDGNEMEFHQIGELNEAAGKGSEIRQNYSELYESANNEVEKYRSISQQIQQENAELKHELQSSQGRYDEEIKRLTSQNGFLERTISENQRNIEEFKGRIAEFTILRARDQKKLQKIQEEYEKIKGFNKSLEFTTNKEIDKLQAIINDKIEEIKELRLEQHQAKQMYQNEIVTLRAKLASFDEEIDQLQQENQKKSTKIEQLVEYQDELRKAVAYAKQNTEHSAVALYEQQFQRIKDDFEDKKRQLKEEVLTCHQEIQALKQEIEEESRRNRVLSEEAQELQVTLVKTQEEYMVLVNVKSELESNYIENLKEFHNQLQQCRELISQKDKIIHDLQTNCENAVKSPYKLKSDNPQVHQEGFPNMRMEYLSRKVSREAQDPRFISTYIQKLQKLLLRYERILAGNESTIQQLQEKVCEYLRDALEKEQQAEMLYSKLVEYESAMNNILVEKITLEIENKRMGKAVELSERKVLILGNKLIDAVGKRPAQESEDSSYYYQ